MPASYYKFRFRFVDADNRALGYTGRQAHVSREDGIELDGAVIHYEDLADAFLYLNRVGLVLKPYLVLPRNLTEHLQPNSPVLLIEVMENLAFEIKSAIDQNRSNLYLAHRQATLEAERKGASFRRVNCPRCDSGIDLTHQATPYIFCRYCETVFDQYRQKLPRCDDYKICPICQYYGRVQTFPETRLYFWKKERRASYQDRYFCDTCAQRLHEETRLKNATLLVGLVSNAYLQNQYTSGRNPDLADLGQANYLAQAGNMKEADLLYAAMTLRNKDNPGLRYNYGLAYLQNGDPKRAFYQLRESLEACKNYEPARQLIQFNRRVEVEKEK
jgi:hypothetical protein